MPYRINEDMPPRVRRILPEHAQDIYRAAFNSAWEQYGGDERAHRIAWAAVKRKYRKANGMWVPVEPAFYDLPTVMRFPATRRVRKD